MGGITNNRAFELFCSISDSIGGYCTCNSCCGCANVTIPTTTTTIEPQSFYHCGGGNELINLIIPT